MQQIKLHWFKGLLILIIFFLAGKMTLDSFKLAYYQGVQYHALYLDCFKDSPDHITIEKLYWADIYDCQEMAAYLFPEAATINEERAEAETKFRTNTEDTIDYEPK